MLDAGGSAVRNQAPVRAKYQSVYSQSKTKDKDPLGWRRCCHFLASWRVSVGAPERQRSTTETPGWKGENKGERENETRTQQLIVLQYHSQIQYWRRRACV